MTIPPFVFPEEEVELPAKRVKKEARADPTQASKFDCPHMENLSQRYAVRIPPLEMLRTTSAYTCVCVVLRVR